MAKQPNLFKSRLKIINFLYQTELMNEPIEVKKAFEENDFNANELKIIEKIGIFYPKLKAIIEKFLVQSWTWNRLAPLERAILLYGAFELQINDIALVINELVIITRGLIPGDNYKYINSVLDKIGTEYENIKNRQKSLKG